MLNSDDVPTSVTSDNKLLYGGQNNSGFSQEQIRFVADHHPLKTFVNGDAEASGYSCSGVTATHGGQAMLDLITAFKNKEKGTVKNVIANFEISVDYDFTQNQSNIINKKTASITSQPERYMVIRHITIFLPATISSSTASTGNCT